MRYAVCIYLLIVNAIAFTAYGIDKRRAQQGAHQRIPERMLILLAAIGGSIGAYCAMRLWRHKTQHIKFRLGIPALLAIHIALAVWIMLSISN